ncbi:oligosaccharide flippase family protein [uncultured Maribacter sp.]|uniref:oligosaccharide flippase family protein n=1 Tax=uncultured Maribacter sp. TaxID=431308 RepID=UPI002616D960|nr:oligosaccharide flippase family protein [uncultured Maribacter sp.]
MLNRFTQSITKYRILLSNLGYLSIIKVFNLILPLLIFPYLLRVLGKENYGLIIFAESIITYFVIFINYGFNLSATKEISIHRNDKKKVNEIISSVYIIKGIFFIISFCFLFIVFYLSDIAETNKMLFFLTMSLGVYEFLNPVWYFQGIEKLKPITIISLISKLAFLIAIFLFVKNQEDFLLVPLINGLCLTTPLLVILSILYKKENLSLKFPQKHILLKYFKESSLYFTSSISIQIVTNTNRFLIGSLIGLDKLAIYDILEKFIRILSVPTSMLRQVLLPYVSLNKDKIIVRKTTILMTTFGCLIVLLGFVFATEILELLFEDNTKEASFWLKLYLPIIILFNISNYYGVVSLNAFNLQKYFLKGTLYSVLTFCFGLLFIYLFNEFFEVKYLIINSLLIEIVFAFYVYKKIIKNKLL